MHCYAPIAYLMEYAFTFRHRNSPHIHEVRGTQQTYGWTDSGRHFIMSPPYGGPGNNKRFCSGGWIYVNELVSISEITLCLIGANMGN